MRPLKKLRVSPLEAILFIYKLKTELLGESKSCLIVATSFPGSKGMGMILSVHVLVVSPHVWFWFQSQS